MGVVSVTAAIGSSIGNGGTGSYTAGGGGGGSVSGATSVWSGSGFFPPPALPIKEPETLAELVDMGINGPTYIYPTATEMDAYVGSAMAVGAGAGVVFQSGRRAGKSTFLQRFKDYLEGKK